MGLLRASDVVAADESAPFARQALSRTVGKIRTLTGSVAVVDCDGESVSVVVGSPLCQGDRIETGADGRVGIIFDDGTAFNLTSDSKIELAEFTFDAEKVLTAARLHVDRGRFAFVAGETATREGLSIDTPFATIRGRAYSGAIGTLTLVGFTIAMLQNLQAAGNAPILVDDLITFKELNHGTLLIAPKGGTTKGIVLDDPELTIIIGPPETGFNVQQVVNSAADMAALIAASEQVNVIYVMGQADPFTTGSTQRAETHLFFPDTPIIRVAATGGGLLPPLGDSPNTGTDEPETGGNNAPPVIPNQPTLTFVIDDDRVLSHDDTPGAQDEVPDNSPGENNDSDDTADEFPIDLAGIDGVEAANVIGQAQDGTAATPFVNTSGSAIGDGSIAVAVEASAAGVDSGLSVTGGDRIFLFTETTDDGNQVVVGREGSEGAADPDGDIAFIVFVTEDGQTLWMQQSMPIDHGDDNNDFDSTQAIADAALLVRVTLTDGDESISQTLPVGDHVLFEDDGPVPQNDTAEVVAESELATVNAFIILDKSGSMGSDSSPSSRISLAKAAILDFASQENVLSIRILPFDSNAATPSAWFDLTTDDGFDDLVAYLDNITGNGGTNYQDAILDTQSSWVSPPNDADLDNVYFISDGAPSTGLTASETTAWESFLVNNGIDDSYAIAIGTDANNIHLQRIAYPNVPDQTNNVVVLDSVNDLSGTLQDTTLTGTASGNVLYGESEPIGDEDNFGSDGMGMIKTLHIDSDGDGVVDEGEAVYTFDGNSVSLDGEPAPDSVDGKVSFETDAGGQFSFDFETGDWDYTTPELFEDEFTENFTYTITDGDGDQSAPASLTITVMPPSDQVALYLESAQHNENT